MILANKTDLTKGTPYRFNIFDIYAFGKEHEYFQTPHLHGVKLLNFV